MTNVSTGKRLFFPQKEKALNGDQEIEIEENGEDITVTSHAGFHSYSYDVEGSKPEQEDVEERLRKLVDLYTKSLITREEYEQKKKEILDEL